MSIFLWIVFGALVGWIASIITHNNARMGLIKNIIVGLIGSFIGAWIASLFGFGTLVKFTWTGFLFALLGAVLFLMIINLLFNRKR
jgi:uncharacterized membrane protein YeaQ/YmgE (transglycosylase-associated protein family)